MLSTRVLVAALTGLLTFASVSAAADNDANLLSMRATCPCYADYPDLYEAGIDELSAGMAAGKWTSLQLVKAYLARIDEVNLKGPMLRAVIETNPHALELAAEKDAMRKKGKIMGPLHGIPILIKDNIGVQAEDGMNTTAGSYALVNSITAGDSHVVKGLKSQGAIILGKTNLGQWAFWRSSSGLPNGWTSVGGQCTNPYFPFGNPSGSSSGTGIAMAIGLATAGLGSDTGGSVISPSSSQNLVGLRSTIGLISRTGVVPLSEHHDTVGPMARSVKDVALLMNAIAGPDPTDNYTLAQPTPLPDYTAGLKTDALKGVRLGIHQPFINYSTPQGAAFVKACAVLEGLGATIVTANITNINSWNNGTLRNYIFGADFKIDIAKYFASLKYNPSGVKDLQGLIDFNNDHPDLEEPPTYTSMDLWYTYLNTSADDPMYRQTIEFLSVNGKGGIDAALKDNNVSALIMYSVQSGFSALSGYPQITLPLSFLPSSQAPVQQGNHTVQTYSPFPGQPYGFTFAGTGYSEAMLLSYAYAFEQATHHRLEKRAYYEAIPKTQLPDVM